MVFFMLALGCAPEATLDAAPPLDEQALEKALLLVQPDQALTLLDGLVRAVDQATCPVDRFEDGLGLREVWSACPGGDVLGSVDRYEDDQLAWIEVRRLAWIEGGEVFRMDGAVEHMVEDDTATLELAATICGPGWGTCADPVQVDLSWTLVDRGAAEDVLVTGTLSTFELGPTEVEGTWSVATGCDQPQDGLLLLEGEQVHAFRFDEDCDGCAAWTADGAGLGAFCR
jgi:hypothetical protein